MHDINDNGTPVEYDAGGKRNPSPYRPSDNMNDIFSLSQREWAKNV